MGFFTTLFAAFMGAILAALAKQVFVIYTERRSRKRKVRDALESLLLEVVSELGEVGCSYWATEGRDEASARAEGRIVGLLVLFKNTSSALFETEPRVGQMCDIKIHGIRKIVTSDGFQSSRKIDLNKVSKIEHLTADLRSYIIVEAARLPSPWH